MSKSFVKLSALMLCLVLVFCAAGNGLEHAALTAMTDTQEFSEAEIAVGALEQNTVALTIGTNELTNADLAYYFMDAVNAFNRNYGNYAFLYGLDTSKPLNMQVYNPATGETWADNFIAEAIANAHATYALCSAAAGTGMSLSDETLSQLVQISYNLDTLAAISGLGSNGADVYLKSHYGKGATKAGYIRYYSMSIMATEYYNAYSAGLVITPEQVQEANEQNPTAYNGYSFNQYYLSAEEATEEALATLTDPSVNSVDALNAAIASVKEGAASTAANNQRVGAMAAAITEWVTDSARQAGDVTAIANPSKDDASVTDGYYIVLFRGCETYDIPMVNVRHILIGFGEGENGKANALASAEKLLADWQAGEATEDSFGALANANSTDGGSNTKGGLYENVYPGQMVTPFNDWCFDSSRQVGDTGIVETNYGYHIMYFSGTCDQTYRESLISSELHKAAVDEWYSNLLAETPYTIGDTQYLPVGMAIAH